MTIFLNSFRPLIRYPEGQQAILAFHLPPFIDYSCRREPDFMSTYPSISALCRVEKFAPRLHVLPQPQCERLEHWLEDGAAEMFKDIGGCNLINDKILLRLCRDQHMYG